MSVAISKTITGFNPITHSLVSVLILGSMPGIKSLNAGEYYAHKQNVFWRIIGELTGLDPDAPYLERVQGLLDSNIALWDVLYSCEREGSSDAAIDTNTIKPNDFITFFHEHAHIKLVCFNGATAERYYRTYVAPMLNKSSIIYVRLPSTSPAHATLSFQEKTMIWHTALGTQL